MGKNLFSGSPVDDFVKRLESRDDLPALSPRSDWDSAMTRELLDRDDADLFGGAIVDGPMAAAVRSALLLWNDALDESHTLSQDLHSATGSYLHGIMHRREPDYGNGKYWFNRVGSHELFPTVGDSASAYAPLSMSGNWDPFAFIDLCEDAAHGRLADDVVAALKELQRDEMKLLLEYCFKKATGQ